MYDFSSNDVAKQFKEKLKKTKIFIIPVPKYTDLNRYFETMNNRGIQLSQTDLVKAELLENLKEKGLSKICSVVWDACSNMDAYFQKTLDASTKRDFISDGNPKTARAFVLGDDWNSPLEFKNNLKNLSKNPTCKETKGPNKKNRWSRRK